MIDRLQPLIRFAAGRALQPKWATTHTAANAADVSTVTAEQLRILGYRAN